MRHPPVSAGETTSREIGMSRIGNNVLERAFDNSDRRQFGQGVLGRLFGFVEPREQSLFLSVLTPIMCGFTHHVRCCRRSLKGSVARQPKVREQLEDIEDHRPFFTYWVTTVQILILFISIACYGFGTIGFNLNQRSGLVSDKTAIEFI